MSGDADRLRLDAADGHRIDVYRWLPPGDPAVMIQVLHGLSEHAGRYERFAAACNAAGYGVVAHDHRGHGPGAAVPGHFADREGWRRVIGDALVVNGAARELAGGRPLALLGHSMGSYLAQGQLVQAPGSADLLILSGSTWPRRAEVRSARTIAMLGLLFRGRRAPAKLLERMSFGAYNRRFAPARTAFDWLSRDPAEVDRYVADPLCGNPATHALWRDLLGGLLDISTPRALARVPAALPILVTGGSDDPVGGARRMSLLAEAYRRSGKTDVSLGIYPGGRHEMLNETNRDAVIADLLAWIAAHC